MTYHQITFAERYTLGLLRRQGLATKAYCPTAHPDVERTHRVVEPMLATIETEAGDTVLGYTAGLEATADAKGERKRGQATTT